MKCLTFRHTISNAGESAKYKAIRSAVFESRSSLPVSAACVVANGVRETLSALIGMPVTLRLLEPHVPSPAAWAAILDGARLYRVRGKLADAAIVWRTAEACLLAAAIFGEPAAAALERGELSPIESEIIERVSKAISANLSAVCGNRETVAIERASSIEGFVTYFELLLEAPVAARIGVALSREPSPDPRGAVEFAHLASVGVPVRLSLEVGNMPAINLSALEPGCVIPVSIATLARCQLRLKGRRLARGEGGVSDGHYALAVRGVAGS